APAAAFSADRASRCALRALVAPTARRRRWRRSCRLLDLRQLEVVDDHASTLERSAAERFREGDVALRIREQREVVGHGGEAQRLDLGERLDSCAPLLTPQRA